jgi:hypothetical protein
MDKMDRRGIALAKRLVHSMLQHWKCVISPRFPLKKASRPAFPLNRPSFPSPSGDIAPLPPFIAPLSPSVFRYSPFFPLAAKLISPFFPLEAALHSPSVKEKGRPPKRPPDYRIKSRL